MPADRPLAEIVAEGRAIETGCGYEDGVDLAMARGAFSRQHGPTLLACAEAAMEAERLLRHALDESSGAVDSYEALWIMQSAAREALAAFDAALARLAQEGRR